MSASLEGEVKKKNGGRRSAVRCDGGERANRSGRTRGTEMEKEKGRRRRNTHERQKKVEGSHKKRDHILKGHSEGQGVEGVQSQSQWHIEQQKHNGGSVGGDVLLLRGGLNSGRLVACDRAQAVNIALRERGVGKVGRNGPRREKARTIEQPSERAIDEGTGQERVEQIACVRSLQVVPGFPRGGKRT